MNPSRLPRLVLALVFSVVVDVLAVLGSMQLLVSQLPPGSPLFLPLFILVCAAIVWGSHDLFAWWLDRQAGRD